MNIKLIQQAFNEISDPNIITMLANAVFGDFSDIREYNEADMYYFDEVVYVPKSISNSESLFFQCKDNGVTGKFNLAKWNVYGLQFIGNHNNFSFVFKNTNDGTTEISISNGKFNPLVNDIIIHHSVRGRLIKDIDWRLSSDNSKILLIGFSLYGGEYISVDIVSK